jgi:hypothetical protein
MYRLAKVERGYSGACLLCLLKKAIVKDHRRGRATCLGALPQLAPAPKILLGHSRLPMLRHQRLLKKESPRPIGQQLLGDLAARGFVGQHQNRVGRLCHQFIQRGRGLAAKLRSRGQSLLMGAVVIAQARVLVFDQRRQIVVDSDLADPHHRDMDQASRGIGVRAFAHGNLLVVF